MTPHRSLAALAMLCLAATPLHAATTINVNGTPMVVAVDGFCSLLEAVQAANTNATVNECAVGGGGPPFTIELTPVTYTLTVPAQIDGFWGSSGLVIGPNDVIINGNGALITRDNAAPLMQLMIVTGGSLVLRSLRLTNGRHASPFWGGVMSMHSGAVVSMERVSAFGNSADEGSVVNAASGTTINIVDSFIGGNTANLGGGTTIRLSDADANVANSTFNNAAFGEFAVQGPAGRAALLSNVTIFGDVGYAASGATMTVNRSIMGSCAQAGPALLGTLNLGAGCPGSLGAQPELMPGLWGGPTTTYALVLPNAAMDAGGACTFASAGPNPLFANGAPIAFDQRGFPRAGSCDLGAFETFPIAPAPQALPDATVGVGYNQVLTASGGTPSYTYALLSPAVPPPAGLTLGAATGAISGTPTTAGPVTFVVTATDSNGFAALHRYDINVLAAPQTITFGALADRTFGSAPFNVSATASSGLTVTFSSLTPATCSVAGTLVTLVAGGPCTIAADQAGDANYAPAPQVTQSFSVLPAAQTITFGALANRSFGDPPFTVSATASSGLTVVFSSLTPAVCTVSGTLVTLVAAGTCTIAANQAGDANYAPAPQVTQGFLVNAVLPGAPTGLSATVGTGSATISFSPPAFTGGAPITAYTVTCNPGGIAASGPASPITVTGLVSGTNYTCTVTATNSAGTGPGASIPVSLAMASQTITFAPLAPKTTCDPPFAVSATASSGLPVAFASQTATTCSVAGSTVTLLAAGTCTIVATQAGDASYSAAAPVAQSFSVAPAAALATSGASGTGTGPIAVTVTVSDGGCGRQFTLAQFLPSPPGTAPVPPTAPPGVVFPHGLFNFILGGVASGSSATFTITYPGAVDGMPYWKYGPTAGDPTPHWYVLPATAAGNTVTFTIADGGLGDDDLAANGTIVDQGGPGVGVTSSHQTPTLSQWMLMGLAAFILLAGMAGRRRMA